MVMLHKHPESGDILNLQDAFFFFSGKKKTYYIDIRTFYWMTDLDMENFKQINLWRKFGSCVQVFKKHLKTQTFFSIYWVGYT